MVSATHFIPTQRPAKRDMPSAFNPKSRISVTPAGSSTGISTSMKEYSQPEVMVEDLQEGSSPASASTPPLGAVPAELACRSASPLRSTPGPLPYQMPKTPSYLAFG